VSKRIGLEPRGLARIFGEEVSAAAGQDGNIAVPAAGTEERHTEGGTPGVSAGLPDGNAAGRQAGDVAGQPSVQPAGQLAVQTGAQVAGQVAGQPASDEHAQPAALLAGSADGRQAASADGQASILQAIPEAAGSEATVAAAGEFAEVVRAVYKTDADKPLTFRFAREENEWLETVCFEITRATGVKMHKQDLVRLGLNVILADYKRRGDRSYAVQLSRKLGRADV
jgi:hypothetical protein